MMQLDVQEAGISLPGLVRRALAGEEIVIAAEGGAQVRLVPVGGTSQPRCPGSMKGRIVLHDDFDAPLPPEGRAPCSRFGLS